jgi:PRC-barrel domain
MNDPQQDAGWNVADWHGKLLVDVNGEKIGKLQDVYVDVGTDEPQFATIKEGFIGPHLTFVPLGGIQVGPDAPERGAPDSAVDQQAVNGPEEPHRAAGDAGEL